MKTTVDPGRNALTGIASLQALGVPLAQGARVCRVGEPPVVAWPAGRM